MLTSSPTHTHTHTHTHPHTHKAAERTETQREQHRKEEGQRLAEMGHMVTSDILTECPEAAERGQGRVLTDRWRGMTPQQLSAIHREREEQRLRKQVHLLIMQPNCVNAQLYLLMRTFVM